MEHIKGCIWGDRDQKVASVSVYCLEGLRLCTNTFHLTAWSGALQRTRHTHAARIHTSLPSTGAHTPKPFLCTHADSFTQCCVVGLPRFFFPQCLCLQGLLDAVPQSIKPCLSPSGMGSVINFFLFFFCCWENTERWHRCNTVDWQINEVAIGVGSSKGRQEVDCTHSDSSGMCLMGSPNAVDQQLLMTCHLQAVWGALPPRFMAHVVVPAGTTLGKAPRHSLLF